MSRILKWEKTKTPGGIYFANDVIPEYEIKQDGKKFYVIRTVDDCQDIGPLKSFEAAEGVVLKLGRMLVEFEEEAWRICAAQAMSESGLLGLTPLPIEGAPADVQEFMKGVKRVGDENDS